MQKLSLDALARELLKRAAEAAGGRAAQTVVGGHERVLRQTVIAMVRDATLAEHANPGEASLHVLRGRVLLSASDHAWEGREGDRMPTARYEILIAGLGEVAQTHLRVLEQTPGAELVAGLDIAAKPEMTFRGHAVP